ncbi:MAG TPA: hypothetical protein VFQ35_05465, partial [Polyangiaceae bacterium]|nr:hypothetical protein [Polyangiaceae bacterium]
MPARTFGMVFHHYSPRGELHSQRIGEGEVALATSALSFGHQFFDFGVIRTAHGSLGEVEPEHIAELAHDSRPFGDRLGAIDDFPDGGKRSRNVQVGVE